MRVLFSTTAGAGHFGPSIPVAHACLAAGHEVLVTAPESFADHVRGAGFEHYPFPDVEAARMGAIFGRLPSLPRREANRLVISEVFGRLDAQSALPVLLAVVGDWHPDVVVRDPVEFGSMVAAARFGVPDVQVAIGVGGFEDEIGTWLDEPLRELSELAGMSVGPGVDHAFGAPTLTSVPATFDRVGTITPDRTWRYRAATAATGPALPAQWGDPDLPLVYVSFGSVAGAIDHFAGVYGAALTALAELPVRVLLTTGNGFDAASLEPVPANAYVTPWWPQESVMTEAALVVGHGGFGTTMSAVRAGVPQVVLPLFSSDQFVNAERVAASGVGRQLPDGPASVPDLPATVLEVLGDDRYRAAAQALADEIAALPEVGAMVEVLSDIASGSGTASR